MRKVCRAFLAIALLFLGVDAKAQQFPRRPVTIMIGLAAGGLTDTTARLYAETVSKATGWTCIVENRPGAGGAIAATAVQNARPDGYTLLIFSGSQHATMAAIHPNTYRSVTGFAPITLLFSSEGVLSVPSTSPAHSVKELFELGKTKPGGLLFGTQGIGSPTHLLGAKLTMAAKVSVQYVHYRGGAAMMPDFVAGRVDFAFPTMTTAAPFVAEGKIRALAVDAGARIASLPEVPTLAEIGLGNETVANWFGMAAPTGTPERIIARLREAFVAASQDPSLKKRLAELDTPIVTSSSEEMARLMKREADEMDVLVNVLGLRTQ